MSLRLYDVLETTLGALEDWRASSLVTKDDVIDSMRQRILLLKTHIVTTPLIGTAFAYPGDIDAERLQLWLSHE